MQIVFNEDNLHEISKPVFWEKYCNMWPVENFTRVLSINKTRGMLSSKTERK